MRGFAVVAALIATAAPAFGQSPQLDPKTPADQAERYVRALDACDVGTVSSMLDPDVSSLSAAGQFAQSKEIYIKVVQAICNSGAKVNLKTDMLRSETFGDTALDVFEMTGTANVGGKSVPTNQRVTMVLRRNPADGAWRILHIQTANAR